jgi:hypothetical protein
VHAAVNVHPGVLVHVDATADVEELQVGGTQVPV